MTTAERPDDSGQFSDDELADICFETLTHDPDPVTSRDGAWLWERYNALQQRVAELEGALGEWTIPGDDAVCVAAEVAAKVVARANLGGTQAVTYEGVRDCVVAVLEPFTTPSAALQRAPEGK